MIIKNKEELLSKDLKEGRGIILRIIERTIREMNYYTIIKKILRVEDNILKINDIDIKLDDVEHVYIIAGGKNSSFMALALEDALGERISEGVVIEKKGCQLKTKKIPIILAGHPMPDRESVRGAEEVIRIAGKASKKDLLIICVSGGWTALASSPPEGVTLREFEETYDLLLKSGVPIEKMNIIRNHLSSLGRGKLAILANEATVIGLISVDEIGGLPWGPTVPDNSTFKDAIKVLNQYNLMESIPSSVKSYLEEDSFERETPKQKDYDRRRTKVHNIVIADNIMMCSKARREATKLGIKAHVFSTGIEGEAKDVGKILAGIAKTIHNVGTPFEPPCLLIAGGETTVSIQGENHGEGGRNQEMVLSAAQEISGFDRIFIASIATDGTDGPTNIAGAIVDGNTVELAERKGINIEEELEKHNSSSVFRRIKDAVYTYDTGTNLMDLMVIYVA